MPRGVLVERAHPDAALERLEVAVLHLGERVGGTASVRLRGEEVVAAVVDRGRDEVVDVLQAVDLGDRVGRRTR